jgi:hypothetical protein
MESLQSVRIDAGVLGVMLKIPSSVFFSVLDDGRVEVVYSGHPKRSLIKTVGIVLLMCLTLGLLTYWTRPSEQPLLLGFGCVLMGAAWLLQRKKNNTTLAHRRLLFSKTELLVREVMLTGKETSFTLHKKDVARVYPVAYQKKEGAVSSSSCFTLHLGAGARHIVFQEPQSELLTLWLGHVLGRWAGVRVEKH